MRATLRALIIGQGLTTPTLASIVAGRSPHERRGGALGLQQMAGGLGRVVGPVLAGALFQHVGVGAPYVAGAGITAGALALVLTLHEQPVGLGVGGTHEHPELPISGQTPAG